MADSLGRTVINKFRQNDMDHGGQDAPFAPAYHRALSVDCGVPYDDDGRIAAAGRINERALTTLLSSGYFGQRGPKSLNPNAFSAEPVSELSPQELDRECNRSSSLWVSRGKIAIEVAIELAEYSRSFPRPSYSGSQLRDQCREHPQSDSYFAPTAACTTKLALNSPFRLRASRSPSKVCAVVSSISST